MRRKFQRFRACGHRTGHRPRSFKGLSRPWSHHFRDIHTTILHLMGLDQNELTYPHLGRNERLTLIEGETIEDLL